MTLQERAATHNISSTKIPGHDTWLGVGRAVVSRTPTGETGPEKVLAVTSEWHLSGGPFSHVTGRTIRYMTASGWRDSDTVVSIGGFIW